MSRDLRNLKRKTGKIGHIQKNNVCMSKKQQDIGKILKRWCNNWTFGGDYFLYVQIKSEIKDIIKADEGFWNNLVSFFGVKRYNET